MLVFSIAPPQVQLVLILAIIKATLATRPDLQSNLGT